MSKRDCSALGTLQPALVEINANNMTVRNRLGQAQSDRPGATAAIEDGCARAEVRYEETRVDIRAAQPYRSLQIALRCFLSPRASHVQSVHLSDRIAGAGRGTARYDAVDFRKIVCR